MRLNRTAKALLPLMIAAIAGACDEDGTSGTNGTDVMEAVPIATGLAAPVHLTAPAGDDRLFIVEIGGTIRIVEGGATLAAPFLDISSKVSTGGERGLLSMAFDPLFATNRRFYVNYTDVDGHTRVERYLASAADPDLADAASAELILMVEQPEDNHNGGHILFGPDGMLYVAMGDGGGDGDPHANGQDLGTLLGALLRLDVRGAAPYQVPLDNPFVANANARPEIWAYGLRNPWRIAFDDASGRLYIADVGQREMEEVNIEDIDDGGQNYGWNVMEGTACYGATTCDQMGLTLPRHTYDHEGGLCSITGGSVYRGTAMNSLRGHYFYADLCRAGFRSFRLAGEQATDHQDWDLPISSIVSFGTDSAGELYVVSMSGTVYRLRFAD